MRIVRMFFGYVFCLGQSEYRSKIIGNCVSFNEKMLLLEDFSPEWREYTMNAGFITPAYISLFSHLFLFKSVLFLPISCKRRACHNPIYIGGYPEKAIPTKKLSRK